MLQRCEKCKRIYNDINNKSCPFCKSNSKDLPNEYKKIEKKENLDKNNLLQNLLNIRSRRQKQLQHIEKTRREKRYIKSPNLLFSESKEDRETRKENRKVIKELEKREKQQEKKKELEAKRQRKLYIQAKTSLFDYEKLVSKEKEAIATEIQKLKNLLEQNVVADKEGLLIKNQLKALEVKQNNLTEKSNNLQAEMKTLNSEIISLEKTLKKYQATYRLLKNAYFKNSKSAFEEIVNNQIKFNQPVRNSSIETQIQNIKMNKTYMEYWINRQEDYSRICPGGCTTSLGKSKRVYRDTEAAQSNKGPYDLYTYLDEVKCKYGFHNSSRKEYQMNRKNIGQCVVIFKKIEHYFELSNKNNDYQSQIKDIKTDYRNLESNIVVQADDSLEIKIDSLETKMINIEKELEDKKALFSEKEKNYFEHGLFITDFDLDRDASA
tara:strand:- start:352 stop:1659 length:1308 start_codon:yes stop_codon:yes gene_type:complete